MVRATQVANRWNDVLHIALTAINLRLMYLSHLRVDRPPYLKSQTEALEWLAQAYFRATPDGADKKSLAEVQKLLSRVACRPPHIETRAHYSPAFQADPENPNQPIGDADLFPQIPGDAGAKTPVRMKIFEREARRMIEDLFDHRKFADQKDLASHLLHVTCTGYVAPSPAENFVLAKGLGQSTLVTHLYHMGCYAAIPALRMAEGLTLTGKDVDVVHTELCTLHLQPQNPTLERMVIESLFADGGAAYRLSRKAPKQSHFKVISLRQELLPNTSDLMAWVISDFGMEMRLDKDVPKAIRASLRDFQQRWLDELKMKPEDFHNSSFAIHPGGPRIIDQVKESFELSETSVLHSRSVLQERGNMSSVTLPHIWKRILDDPQIPSGERVFSYAFGPGLTVAAALLEKVEIHE